MTTPGDTGSAAIKKSTTSPLVSTMVLVGVVLVGLSLGVLGDVMVH